MKRLLSYQGLVIVIFETVGRKWGKHLVIRVGGLEEKGLTVGLVKEYGTLKPKDLSGCLLNLFYNLEKLTKMAIKKVYQRGKYDCMVACVATAARRTYEEVAATLRFDPNDMYDLDGVETPYALALSEVLYLLFANGASCIELMPQELLGMSYSAGFDVRCKVSNMPTMEKLKYIIKRANRPCVLTVDKLDLHGLHGVFYDHVLGQVWDLSKEGMEPLKLGDVNVLHAVMLYPDLTSIRNLYNTVLVS